jgi:hypothetical protein
LGNFSVDIYLRLWKSNTFCSNPQNNYVPLDADARQPRKTFSSQINAALSQYYSTYEAFTLEGHLQ